MKKPSAMRQRCHWVVGYGAHSGGYAGSAVCETQVAMWSTPQPGNRLADMCSVSSPPPARFRATFLLPPGHVRKAVMRNVTQYQNTTRASIWGKGLVKTLIEPPASRLVPAFLVLVRKQLRASAAVSHLIPVPKCKVINEQVLSWRTVCPLSQRLPLQAKKGPRVHSP